MSFCLDDGSELLYGPATHDDEPATAIDPKSFKAANAANRSLPSESPTAMFRDENESKAEGNSIAVLPFAHLSSQPDDEYFCDGLAEEILNALTKIGELKVAARMSAFSFKGKDIGIAEVAEKLGVNSILEGSVRKAGDHIRITVQLVNVADGYQVWSERYDREMKDIFALQDEITLAVVDALKVTLLGAERSAVLKKGTESPEAYELYLRGRYLWNWRTVDSFKRAMEQFQKAIEIDPDYALAYTGLADCLLFLGYYEALSPADAAPRVKEAVTKALAMDHSLADAHASMAMYRVYYEFDWKAGEQGLQKAIELNPKLPAARYWYCSILDAFGRFEESIEQGRVVLELDPLNLIAHSNIARAVFHERRYDESIAIAKRIQELAPEFWVAYWTLGAAYMESGRHKEAIENLTTAATKSGLLVLRAFVGCALANAGRRDEARQILVEFIEESKRRYVSPLCMCVVSASLGEIEQALDWLEDAWRQRTILLMWLKTEPIFDPLRNEPRFKEVQKKMNLLD